MVECKRLKVGSGNGGAWRSVSEGMMRQRVKAVEWLIVGGAAVFIAMLVVAAYWEASIRWLHFFQAWMYVAAIALSLRKNRWGYFVGFAAGFFWDYANLFVTTFFRNGLEEAQRWMSSGHLQRADLLIAVPAWFGNLALVAGCAWAYLPAKDKRWSDVARLAAAFAATMGFFALDMAIFQPQYLGLFRGLLHPRFVW